MSNEIQPVTSMDIPTDLPQEGISPGNHQIVMGAKRLQNLHAVRVNACPSCQAPGVWKGEDDRNVEYFRASWSGILVPAGDERIDQPVGDQCPHCKGSRVAVPEEDLGVIWSRETRGF